MVVVIKKMGDTKDAMFRKFSRIFIEENILDDVRKKQFYKKPSLKKKEDAKERIRMRAKRRKFSAYRRSRKI